MPKSSIKSAAEQLEFDFGQLPQPPAHHEPLLSVGEASAAFNLRPHVLRRAIKAKSIPFYRIGNGRIRLRASDITAAIDASRQGTVK
jgi:excisionase family DNA binding protein